MSACLYYVQMGTRVDTLLQLLRSYAILETSEKEKGSDHLVQPRGRQRTRIMILRRCRPWFAVPFPPLLPKIEC